MFVFVSLFQKCLYFFSFFVHVCLWTLPVEGGLCMEGVWFGRAVCVPARGILEILIFFHSVFVNV